MANTALREDTQLVIDHLTVIAEYPLSSFTSISRKTKGSLRTIELRRNKLHIKIELVDKSMVIMIVHGGTSPYSALYCDEKRSCDMLWYGHFGVNQQGSYWHPVCTKDTPVSKTPPSEVMQRQVFNALHNVGQRYIQRFARVDMM